MQLEKKRARIDSLKATVSQTTTLFQKLVRSETYDVSLRTVPVA